MTRKLAKARRILAAQVELDRLAAWGLVDLERQSASLDERHHALIRYLDAEAPFGGVFAGAMIRRLAALEASRAVLRHEQAAQAQARLTERARTRSATGIVEALERAARRWSEQQRLAEAIEAALGQLAQGPGKFDGGC